ncbi:OmpA family protein [Streptomyces inhibens]|uniref:OmpA family protein n=1 Tax=Streptomyces inhibens TaxID=2293571 RepID=UPI0037A87CC6
MRESDRMGAKLRVGRRVPGAVGAFMAWAGWAAFATRHYGGARSCSIAPTAIGTTRHGAPRHKPPLDPVVHYANDRPETYELPGAALFDTNASAVRATALPLLNDVAVSARTTPGSRVSVFGYVDPRGRPDNNQQLSQARADAVKKVLIGLGVTRVNAYGRGLPEGCSTKPSHAAKGRMSAEDRLQCDRRVDIEIVRK